MSTRMVLIPGGAVTVYDDRFRVIAEAIGSITITRATRVEFEPTTGEWVATHIKSGVEIARGRNRSEVIQAEVAWLEENVIGGKS